MKHPYNRILIFALLVSGGITKTIVCGGEKKLSKESATVTTRELDQLQIDIYKTYCDEKTGEIKEVDKIEIKKLIGFFASLKNLIENSKQDSNFLIKNLKVVIAIAHDIDEKEIDILNKHGKGFSDIVPQKIRDIVKKTSTFLSHKNWQSSINDLQKKDYPVFSSAGSSTRGAPAGPAGLAVVVPQPEESESEADEAGPMRVDYPPTTPGIKTQFLGNKPDPDYKAFTKILAGENNLYVQASASFPSRKRPTEQTRVDYIVSLKPFSYNQGQKALISFLVGTDIPESKKESVLNFLKLDDNARFKNLAIKNNFFEEDQSPFIMASIARFRNFGAIEGLYFTPNVKLWRGNPEQALRNEGYFPPFGPKYYVALKRTPFAFSSNEELCDLQIIYHAFPPEIDSLLTRNAELLGEEVVEKHMQENSIDDREITNMFARLAIGTEGAGSDAQGTLAKEKQAAASANVPEKKERYELRMTGSLKVTAGQHVRRIGGFFSFIFGDDGRCFHHMFEPQKDIKSLVVPHYTQNPEAIQQALQQEQKKPRRK